MPEYASLAASLGVMGVLTGKELRARCPLHDDTSPSFSLNVESGAWICFAKCGGGEFFRLVQLVLNCNPGEARDWMQSNGTRISVENLSARMNSLLNPGDDPDFMPEDLGWRARYRLLDSKTMPLWFLERGFTWTTINNWGIKYDPMWDAVIIPVYWEDELVGTITRNIHPELPKYVNSKKLPRSDILFGDISATRKEIILVEGVLDAIWFSQNGYNCGSLLGDYLTDGQVEILTRYRYGEIILALDNDEAGIAGRDKAINNLIKAGWLLPQIKVISFPGKKGEPGYKKDAQDCDPELLDELVNTRKDVLSI